MSFKEEMKIRVDEIEQMMTGYLPEETGETEVLAKPMNYSVQVGGKRLRPLLIQEVCRLFDENLPDVYPFMTAMEMLHTSSLVHDDLPALDNDIYRRGKKTTHAKYGEAMAILAGDGLINRAFESIADGMKNAVHLDRCVRAFAVFAKQTGIDGMLGGQAVDVFWTGNALSKERLLFIHEKKTGALISASMQIGAILGGAEQDEEEWIRKAGLDIGMAFQIQDDLLDIYGDDKELGKPTHSDEKNEKTTYVSIYGVERSRRAVKEYSEHAKEMLGNLSRRNEFLEQLIDVLVERKK